ncbi:hypothetical protein [Nonomuraea sp. SYSU D8015]|nr:hypothetical protein [Nonomuraea sp. SYSU D8015]
MSRLGSGRGRQPRGHHVGALPQRVEHDLGPIGHLTDHLNVRLAVQHYA